MAFGDNLDHPLDTDLGYSRTMNPDIAFSDGLGQDVIKTSDGSIGHSVQIDPSISTAPSHQQGLRQQPRPQTSKWMWVAA